MANLKIDSQETLLSFIKENLSNDKNLSIRGLASLCSVQETSLIRGAAFNSEKLAQTLIANGFEAAALVENGFCAKATWLVIEYFAYESKAKAPGAKQIARTFGQIGVQLTFDKLVEHLAPKQTPDEYWIEFRDSGKDYQLGDWANCMVNFSHYAVGQGSKGYKNLNVAPIQFTEMFNRVILEDYNSKVRGRKLDVRDRLGAETLGLIHLLQKTQVNLIKEEMKLGTHYKEIFKLVKNRILGLIEAMYVKPVALLPESNRNLINHSLDAQLALEAA